MKILLVSSQDYIHHPVPSRHHYIFERLSKNHEIHVAHFHISNNSPRGTHLLVEETTLFPFKNLLLHYTLNSPYHLYRFNKIIQENKIDVVVAAHVLAGTAAIYAAKHNNIPVLFDLKDWFPDSAAAYFKNPDVQNIIRDTILRITKYNLKNSTEVTTVSPNLVKKLELLGYKSQLITNGVDTSLFKPYKVSELRKRLGFSESDFVIGFAGSFERWYDLDSMLMMPSLLHNNNIKFLFVGGSLFTDYKNEIIKIIKSRNLEKNVVFTGLVPHECLPDYINCMDVCTIPLIPEQWINIALPNKFFEYSACGKPIITTNIPNVVEFNCPNVYVYNNNQEFSQHLKTIIDTRPTFDLDFEKQDWNHKAKEMENILLDLVYDNNTNNQIKYYNRLQKWKRGE